MHYERTCRYEDMHNLHRDLRRHIDELSSGDYNTRCRLSSSPMTAPRRGAEIAGERDRLGVYDRVAQRSTCRRPRRARFGWYRRDHPYGQICHGGRPSTNPGEPEGNNSQKSNRRLSSPLLVSIPCKHDSQPRISPSL